MELGGVPHVQLGAERRAQLEDRCDDLLDRALAVHDQFHGSTTLDAWSLVRQRDALSVYKLRKPPRRLKQSGSHGEYRDNRTRLLMGSGIVEGTADDAIRGVYCDSTESLRVVKALLSDKFIDGAVLHVCERNPIQAAIVFAGIKWFAMKGVGSGQLIQDREFLTYERMGRIVDRRGQVFTYHVIQSIELPEWPVGRVRRVTRAYLSYCYLYRQLSPQFVGCFMLGDLDVGGRVPRALDDYMSAYRILSAANFRRSVVAKKLSARMAASSDRLASTSTSCDLCLAQPNKLLEPLHVCVGCRRRACRKCRAKRAVFRLEPRSGKPAREIFCRACLAQDETYYSSSSSVVESGPPSPLFADESSAHSSSPRSDQFTELADVEAEYPLSQSQPDAELDKLAAFARRCSMREAPDAMASAMAATAHREPLADVWWNTQEMKRLARVLRKSNRRRRSGSSADRASSSGLSFSRERSGTGSHSVEMNSRSVAAPIPPSPPNAPSPSSSGSSTSRGGTWIPSFSRPDQAFGMLDDDACESPAAPRPTSDAAFSVDELD